MRQSLILGILASVGLAGWNTATMLWPVAYPVWDLGRSTLFVVLVVALTALAASLARSRASVPRVLSSVSAAYAAAAVFNLSIYGFATRVLRDRIVQLPEYLRDYTYHGYESPAIYLSANYMDLFQLQVFSWAVSGVALVVPAGVLGGAFGLLRFRARAA